MDGIVQVREDFVEDPVFAARLYGPGINEGGEQFVKVIGKR